MRIISWNINGIRAATKKGLAEWLHTSEASIVGFQEVRALHHQIPKELLAPSGWFTAYHPAQRPGYSGVGLLARQSPDEILTSIGEERFDSEGRVQIARWGRLVVANVYFPNGGGKNNDNSRVPFKLEFYQRLYQQLEAHRLAQRRVLVIGDFNTAHQEIDLARPAENQKTTGFLPEERAELDRWFSSGWVDTFRQFVTEAGWYSWWSQRQMARPRNIGWRIDYVVADTAAMPFVKDAFIHNQTMGSDHCPVGVDVDPAIVAA